MHSVATERQTLVFPKRIVATGGSVQDAENLLSEKELYITFSPKNVTVLKCENDSHPFVLVDFGRELQGALRLSVARSSKKNMKVRITLGESVTEALSTAGEGSATNDHSPRDFTALTANMGISELGRSGFRFARVELLDEGELSLNGVVAVLKTADADAKGYVKTSDERFNEILDTAIYTAFLCAQDGVIYDGIKRDRIIWSGDLNSEILTLSYIFGNLPHIKNSLSVLMGATDKDKWMNTIPTYSAWWVLNLCDYYMLSGDEEFLTKCADYANSILQKLDYCVENDGTVNFEKDGKIGLAYFLDWPSFRTPEAIPGVVYFLSYVMKKILATRTDKLDKRTAAAILEKLANHEKFTVQMKQTKAIETLIYGATDEAKSFLQKDGARGFNTFMSYFILKAESMLGCERVLEDAKAFYGGMLDRGATTFWEDFSTDWLEGSGRIDEITPEGLRDLHSDYGDFCYKGLRHSLCHGWSTGIVAWAVEELVGLKILEPGFRRVSVKPSLLSLSSIEARIPTPLGDITVSARAGSEPVITVPDGMILEK